MTWKIQEIPPPEELPYNQWQGEVKGKTVFIRSTDAWPILDSVEQGSDGSLRIIRSRRQILWSTQSSIYWDGREDVVPGFMNVFRDRRNYVTGITDHNPGGTPASGPNSCLVKDGLKVPLGPGSAVAWQKDGLIALSVPVDDKNLPAGHEFVTSRVTRLINKGKQLAVRGFSYLGQLPDSSVLLSSGGGDGSGGAGRVYMGEGSLSQDELLSVRDSKVLQRWRLPRDWRALGVSQSGWVLVRYQPEVELGWHLACLQRGVLAPIQFARPPGTEGFRWRGTTIGKESVSITAFQGDEDRRFRLSPR